MVNQEDRNSRVVCALLMEKVGSRADRPACDGGRHGVESASGGPRSSPK